MSKLLKSATPNDYMDVVENSLGPTEQDLYSVVPLIFNLPPGAYIVGGCARWLLDSRWPSKKDIDIIFGDYESMMTWIEKWGNDSFYTQNAYGSLSLRYDLIYNTSEFDYIQCWKHNTTLKTYLDNVPTNLDGIACRFNPLTSKFDFEFADDFFDGFIERTHPNVYLLRGAQNHIMRQKGQYESVKKIWTVT